MPTTTREHESTLHQPALCELLPLRDFAHDCIVRTSGAFVAGYDLGGIHSYYYGDEMRNRMKSSLETLVRSLGDYARRHEELPALAENPDRVYPMPPSEPVPWKHRGIPLDRVEDMLANSPAYRQANRVLFSPGTGTTGRPLTPLHGGHVGLLATSGLLNGVFGTGPHRHVACWESIKVTDRFEETDDGITTIRERERFTQSLTLAYADGRTAILADRSKGNEERAPANGHAAVSQDDEGHGN